MQASEEDDGVVDLNVGGMLYSTTRTTLLRYDSMLAAMFSGRHELKRRADGRVFIDRDGELFKYVLQYLRDGDLDVAYLDKGLRERLKREAAFYCLPGLEKKLATDSRLPSTVVLRIGLQPPSPGGAYGELPPSGETTITIRGREPLNIQPRLPKPPRKTHEYEEYVYNQLLPAVLDLYSTACYWLVSHAFQRPNWKKSLITELSLHLQRM